MGTSPKVELITPFIEAAKETFQTMVSMELRRKEVFLKQGFDMYGDISGVVGLSGVTTGTCALSLSNELAEDVVRALLMTPEGESLPEEDLRDGVGELVNMVAGGAKTRLSASQYTFNITLPTIISGGEHEVFHRSNTHCVVIVLENRKGQSLALDVCVGTR